MSEIKVKYEICAGRRLIVVPSKGDVVDVVREWLDDDQAEGPSIEIRAVEVTDEEFENLEEL